MWTLRSRLFTSAALFNRHLYQSAAVRRLSRIPKAEKMEIHLTESESRICSLLDECTTWMKEEKGLETSCRIAGGWVRDKLLGSDSNDIDIALTDMMGLTFAEHFQNFCNTVKGISLEKIAKIESNPDRSKHLETARTSIFDVEVDFVNLRNEEYAEHSRIPTQISFGTPLEDALRRDITINALFYNIHSRAVEDHTQKGLDDLRNGIIRTPLPPRETFMDDPLRVLRCIRFASRFGFELVRELRLAARDPEIQFALGSKISRERVGEELDKMMKGRDPLRAVQLFNELSLYSSIFYIPSDVAPEFTSELAPAENGLAATTILHILLDPSSAKDIVLPPLHPLILSTLTHDTSTRPRLYLASALTPYRAVKYRDRKDKWHLAVEAAIRDGVKLGIQNHYLDGIPALFEAADILKDPKLGGEKERLTMGLLMREKCVHNPHTGSHWTSSLLFALIQELVPLWRAGELDVTEAAARIEQYNAFVARAEELDLPAAVEARPILDGRDAVRILNAEHGGPWTGQVLARVIEWQLDHLSGTKEECEEWLRTEHAAGRVTLDVPSSLPQAKRGRQDGQGSTKKAKIRNENR